MTSGNPTHDASWRDVRLIRPSAIALGNFDGVHLGHRRILEALRARAEAAGLEPVALTFEPHPRQFLFPDAKTSLLTSPREKAALIGALGVTVVTLSFDADLASLAAEDFATGVLMDRLRGACFFLGADHRFGKGGRGDVALLRSLVGAKSGTKDSGDYVTEVPPETKNGELVSSSAIRHYLKNGKVERANAMLGRLYSLSGTVGHGAGRGRGIGFPTANLQVEDSRKILPFGVFGGVAILDGESRSAVANIGLRPTFSGTEPSAEVHLLDWSGDLYGREMTFEFRQRLREEKRFDSTDALRDQIRRDVAGWRGAAQIPVPDPSR
jgi:riboflavin kinase/FMN adenylyltransferase